MCDASRHPCGCGHPRSFNYDSRGRRVNPQGGHYMIPADQFARVVEIARWDPRILNCFRFVPLPSSSAPRYPPPAPPRGAPPVGPSAAPSVAPRAFPSRPPSPSPVPSPFARRR